MSHHSSAPKLPRLKVGLVLDDSLDGTDGVQQYVLTVGAWLGAQGYDVHYLVSETVRGDVEQVHSLSRNIAVRFNGNRMRMPLPASRGEIRKLLKQEVFDVLHVQMPYSPLLAGQIIGAASAETAVVGTFHVVPKSWLVTFFSRLLALWCRKSLARFDTVMSVSPAAQAFARNTFGISSSVIPNPIALTRFRDAEPFQAPPGKRKQHILFLGRLVPRKGCQLLLEAVRLLKEDAGVPPFRVTICGRGPLADDLERFVHVNHLDRQVTFTGFVSEEDKPRYYASSDITVFPSNGGESFGIVLAEAMASGRAAVLAGDNPGYRSVMEACPEDVLFDPYDAAALAKKLSVLLRDKARRAHIAEWQQHHARRFDVERIGIQIANVYDAALQRRRNVQ